MWVWVLKNKDNSRKGSLRRSKHLTARACPPYDLPCWLLTSKSASLPCGKDTVPGDISVNPATSRHLPLLAMVGKLREEASFVAP